MNNEKETQKTVLVTGGNGFIGTMVCKLLVGAGHNVINIDRSKKQQEGVTLYPFDINNNQLKGVIQLTQPDTIIHLAADHEVGRSVTEPHVFYDNNVRNTIALLNHAVESGVKNFIFSSSSSVYGDVLGFPTPEESPKVPMSPYGRTKAMVEDMLKDYANAYDINFVALRYFNAAGADPENTHGYTQEPAHLVAMNYLDDGGVSTEVNIGAGNGQSILEVIAAFEKVTGEKLDWEMGPKRAGDPPMTYADITKANELLGWNPVYTIEDIVTHALAWANKKHK